MDLIIIAFFGILLGILTSLTARREIKRLGLFWVLLGIVLIVIMLANMLVEISSSMASPQAKLLIGYSLLVLGICLGIFLAKIKVRIW
ncbi:hypothetical protein ACFL1I_03790 [Candidatus Omnitrophota bacterium]